MAFKSQFAVVTPTEKTVYTVPADQTASAHTIQATRVTGVEDRVTLSVYASAEGRAFLLTRGPLAEGDHLTFPKVINLNAGDEIRAIGTRADGETQAFVSVFEDTDAASNTAFNARGPYNPSALYDRLDVVSYQGSSYVARVDGVSGETPPSANWALLAEKGDTGGVNTVNGEDGDVVLNANSIGAAGLDDLSEVSGILFETRASLDENNIINDMVQLGFDDAFMDVVSRYMKSDVMSSPGVSRLDNYDGMAFLKPAGPFFYHSDGSAQVIEFQNSIGYGGLSGPGFVAYLDHDYDGGDPPFDYKNGHAVLSTRHDMDGDGNREHYVTKWSIPSPLLEEFDLTVPGKTVQRLNSLVTDGVFFFAVWRDDDYDFHVSAFDTDWNFQWDFDASPDREKVLLVDAANDILYVNNSNGTLHALNTSDGTTLWQKNVGVNGNLGDFDLDNGIVYIWDSSNDIIGYNSAGTEVLRLTNIKTTVRNDNSGYNPNCIAVDNGEFYMGLSDGGYIVKYNASKTKIWGTSLLNSQKGVQHIQVAGNLVWAGINYGNSQTVQRAEKSTGATVAGGPFGTSPTDDPHFIRAVGDRIFAQFEIDPRSNGGERAFFAGQDTQEPKYGFLPNAQINDATFYDGAAYLAERNGRVFVFREPALNWQVDVGDSTKGLEIANNGDVLISINGQGAKMLSGADGGVLWTAFPSDGDTTYRSLALEPDGSAAVFGWNNGNIDKRDGNGNLVWTRNIGTDFGASDIDDIEGINVSPNTGRIVFLSDHYNSPKWGVIEPDGSLRWMRSAPDDHTNRVTMDHHDNVYIGRNTNNGGIEKRDVDGRQVFSFGVSNRSYNINNTHIADGNGFPFMPGHNNGYEYILVGHWKEGHRPDNSSSFIADARNSFWQTADQHYQHKPLDLVDSGVIKGRINVGFIPSKAFLYYDVRNLKQGGSITGAVADSVGGRSDLTEGINPVSLNDGNLTVELTMTRNDDGTGPVLAEWAVHFV